MRICPACAARFSGPAWRCPACAWQPAAIGPIQRVAPTGGADIEYDAAYFRQIAAVESHHFWFVSRNALIAWALRRYFPRAQSMVDVGCGTGQVTAALQAAAPALRLTACEAFLEGLQIAASRAPGAELVEADVRSLPFDEEFDVAGAFDVLEHISDDERVMREMVRAVRRGGGVIVTVPQHPFLWHRMDEHAGHQRRYTRRQLAALARRSGLEIERLTSFVSLLLPAMLVSRLGGMRSGSAPEFHLQPAVNRAGSAIMTAERALIRAGLSLPFGGSLLLVARRR